MEKRQCRPNLYVTTIIFRLVWELNHLEEPLVIDEVMHEKRRIYSHGNMSRYGES